MHYPSTALPYYCTGLLLFWATIVLAWDLRTRLSDLYLPLSVVIKIFMRYTLFMRGNQPNHHSVWSSSVIINRSQRGIPFLPGIILLGLGVVLLVAPRLVLGALALCLLTLGIFLCYVAYKFVMLRKQINTLAKNMEGSLYGGAFRNSKSDSDVIEVDGDKIVYH